MRKWSAYCLLLSLICSVLPVGAPSATAAATIYYVATNGSDSNSGSSSAPFRTIQKAANVAQAGDTVLVREGIYRERVAPPRGGNAGSPITYKAETGKTVIVTGADIWRPSWTQEATNIYSGIPAENMFTDDYYWDDKNPFKVNFSATPEGLDGYAEYIYRGTPTDPNRKYTLGQVIVDGVQYHQVPYITDMQNETNSWVYDATTGKIMIHFPDDNPQNHKVEIATRRTNFAPHVSGLGNINIQGFVFEHAANQYPRDFWYRYETGQQGAIDVRYGYNWNITDNVVRYANTAGITVGLGSMDAQSNSGIGIPGYSVGDAFEPSHPEIISSPRLSTSVSDTWLTNWIYNNGATVSTDVYSESISPADVAVPTATSSLRLPNGATAERSFKFNHQNDGNFQGGFLKFKWFTSGTTASDQLEVQVSDGTNSYTVTVVDGTDHHGEWYLQQIDLPAGLNFNANLTAKIISTTSSSSSYFYVDEISFSELHKGGIVIKGNWLIDNGSNGLLASSSNNIQVTDNVVVRNNNLKFVGVKRYEGAGLKFHDAYKANVSGNYVANNFSPGIWADNQFYNARVSKNILYNNETVTIGGIAPGKRGTFFEMSNYSWDTTLVDNNIYVGNRIYSHDTAGVSYVNNLISGASTKFAIENQTVASRNIRVDMNSYYNNIIFDQGTGVSSIPYPKDWALQQRMDYNLIETNPATRLFRVARYSIFPFEWSYTGPTYDAFISMLDQDLGAASPGFDTLKANGGTLTFNEWKTFWHNKGLDLDAHSVVVGINNNNIATYDESTKQLTVKSSVNPATVGSKPYAVLTTDYFGVTIPQNGTAKPGPFQSLATGTNTFTVWTGKTVLSQGQLPFGNPSTSLVYKPIAKPTSIATAIDRPVAVTVSGADENVSSITYSLVSSPAHGTVSGTGPNWTYTPSNGYVGTDSFTYRVNNGADYSDTVTVSLSVDAIAYNVNDDFESGTLSGGTGWKGNWLINIDGAKVTDLQAHTGVYSLGLKGGSKATRRVNTHGMADTIKLGFWWKPTGTYTAADHMDVRMSDGSVSSTIYTATYDNIVASLDQWNYQEVDISNFKRVGDLKLSFEMIADQASFPIFIDDVKIIQTENQGFENGFDAWKLSSGTASVSSIVTHSGNYSYEINENIDAISRALGSNLNKVGVVWFYDDASDTSMVDFAFADNTTTYVGLGVNTTTTTSKYAYRIGSTYTATSINRSTGWHQFTFDYRSGTGVKLYIDGVQVTTTPSEASTVTSFNRFMMGDIWNDSKVGNVYFDDVTVQDDLPF